MKEKVGLLVQSEWKGLVGSVENQGVKEKWVTTSTKTDKLEMRLVRLG